MTRLAAAGTATLIKVRTLSHERISRVLEYIDAHIGSSLTLRELAEIACLSPFHFGRCFKQTTGTSVHQFLLRQRVARAKHLLRSSDLRVAAIAVAVGFKSPASFASRFRREVGASPGRYRREHI
jgi:AraC family transcriptional regulator